MKEMINFDMPKNQSSIIKVIGVGGGGSNAVNHMFRQGIKGVDFIICNTDAQAMESSPVPTKIQLGERGLGAGSMPAVGKEAASQKIDQIRDILEKNTQMLFITAGMGGGTGTGAAPVIASVARELGILTVGIVTVPFTFEGKKRKLQADEGILELRKYVDTLLIICNDKLRELCGDLKLSEAFNKADDVLTTAAKGIAEIITVTGYINVDFEDVRTVMNNSGKAIMGCAQAEGQNRALEAVKAALSSPLLNDNEIEGASDVLLYITSGQEEISMDEVTEITDYIQNEAKSQAEIIWGNGYDESLGNKISITLIATGFEAHKRNASNQDVKIRHALNDEIKPENTLKVIPAGEENPVTHKPIEIIRKSFREDELQEVESLEDELQDKKYPEEIIGFASQSEPEMSARAFSLVEKESPVIEEQPVSKSYKEDDRTFVFEFSMQEENESIEKEAVSINQQQPENLPVINEQKSGDNIKQREEVKPFEVYIKKPGGDNFREAEKAFTRPSVDLKSQERIERLRNLSMKFKNESAIEELENEPAYVRRNVELKNSLPSSEGQISRYTLYEDSDTKTPEIRSGNSFLHDNVD
ncbi:MAG: cell division protein FtsZ [Bacteroidales bacterium]|jgi:cell division protein FtsZ|nr:cell division protein FtsZ [Bacteroidales bacterium]